MPRKTIRGNQIYTGNVTIGGTLEVTGAATLSGALTPALGLEYNDSTFFVKNTAAPTSKMRFEAGGVTPGQTRVFTVPDYNATLATVGGTETLTAKTLTSPKVGTAICDTGGNEIIKTPATASAVNEFTATNAATGTSPLLSATGGDTNISVKLAAKGTGQIVAANRVVQLTTVTTQATASDQTYTAAQLLGGIILRDPAGGARADLVPAAADLVAAIPGCAVGTSFRFTLRNTADADETITVTTNTGVTTSGTMTVAQNNSKDFLVVVTNVTAATEAYGLYSLGTLVH